MNEEFDYTAVDKILAEHDNNPAKLFAILVDLQNAYGYLPQPALDRVTQATGLTQQRLIEAATSSGAFSLEPMGKYVLRCCKGTVCNVHGTRTIYPMLQQELGVTDDNPTTDDLLFTLKSTTCMGECAHAPVLTVNGTLYRDLTVDKVKALVAELRAQG